MNEGKGLMGGKKQVGVGIRGRKGRGDGRKEERGGEGG